MRRIRALALAVAFLSTGARAFYPYAPESEARTVAAAADEPGLTKRQETGARGIEARPHGWYDKWCALSESESSLALIPRGLCLVGLTWNQVLTERWFTTVTIGQKSERPQEKLHELDARALKPTNSYPIVTATRSSQPTSVPIDQDGTDYSYFSSVKFGSEGKQLRMLIDTGAPDTWVMSSECTKRQCNTHDTYGKADSKTLTNTTASFSVLYGTGKVAGWVVNETVSIAGLNLTLTFGLATEVSDEFLAYPMDGILGLGRPRANEKHPPTLLEALKAEGKLKSAMFGVNLQRNADRTHDGELSLGDWNRAKVRGDLVWVPTVSRGGHWEVKLDDVSVDNKSAKLDGGRTAIIDTGSSLVFIPADDAKKLHALLPRSRQNGEQYVLPCSSTALVRLTFGGVAFDMPPQDYVGKPTEGDMCASNIVGKQALGPTQWLLGDAFLKNVYTVYDLDRSQVGFGKKAGPVSGRASATAASGDSKTATASGSGAASSSPSSEGGNGGGGESASPSASTTVGSPTDNYPSVTLPTDIRDTSLSSAAAGTRRSSAASVGLNGLGLGVRVFGLTCVTLTAALVTL